MYLTFRLSPDRFFARVSFVRSWLKRLPRIGINALRYYGANAFCALKNRGDTITARRYADFYACVEHPLHGVYEFRVVLNGGRCTLLRNRREETN
jgi:hypothetical protein